MSSVAGTGQNKTMPTYIDDKSNKTLVCRVQTFDEAGDLVSDVAVDAEFELANTFGTVGHLQKDTEDKVTILVPGNVGASGILGAQTKEGLKGSVELSVSGDTDQVDELVLWINVHPSVDLTPESKPCDDCTDKDAPEETPADPPSTEGQPPLADTKDGEDETVPNGGSETSTKEVGTSPEATSEEDSQATPEATNDEGTKDAGAPAEGGSTTE